MSNPASRLERVASSSAVNLTASRVVSKGEHWEPARKLIQPWDAWQDTPLPILRLTEHVPDLTGLKRDRLTVIGFGGKGAGGSRWVVRCACGMYGHQRTKFLRAPQSEHRARCPHCDYLEELKAGRVPAASLNGRAC